MRTLMTALLAAALLVTAPAASAQETETEETEAEAPQATNLCVDAANNRWGSSYQNPDREGEVFART